MGQWDNPRIEMGIGIGIEQLLNYNRIFICCTRVYWSLPVLYLMVSLCESSSS